MALAELLKRVLTSKLIVHLLCELDFLHHADIKSRHVEAMAREFCGPNFPIVPNTDVITVTNHWYDMALNLPSARRAQFLLTSTKHSHRTSEENEAY